jgi:pSer/pThr/pTyr-binding forkhead associated (FHA) protein
VVDPSLNKDPDPQSPCPTNAPERVFHLDLDENTLGRQFEGHGVHPEIVVQDPSISRRHLKFIRDAASRFSVLELGSANGTEINAKVLEPGVVTPLQPGDQLTLGMWTRVHVQAR